MRDEPRLTVAMIVKNEEANLPACLASLTPLGGALSEVCIYDTGSSDGTIAAARRWGARVQEGFWDDDFARARNASLAMVNTRWALIVDADDRVEGTPAQVADAMRRLEQRSDGDQVAGVIRVGDQMSPSATDGTPSVRLLQPATVHYRHRLHENVFLRATGAEPPMVSVPTETLRITHVGYTAGEAMAARLERNLRLSDLELAEALSRGQEDRVVAALTNRGRTREARGDLQGANSDWVKARSRTVNAQMRLVAGESLAAGFLKSGAPERVLDLVEELDVEGSDKGFLNLLRGQALAALGRHQEALQALQVVEKPATAGGMSPDITVALRLRAQEAVRAGDLSDAVATLLSLVVIHGQLDGVVSPLVHLWGERPPGALARMLFNRCPTAWPQLSDALVGAGSRGTEVATELRTMWAELGERA